MDDCAACGHPGDHHDLTRAAGPCWTCGARTTEGARDGCPDGYVPASQVYDTAVATDPIPGLRIRLHGTT